MGLGSQRCAHCVRTLSSHLFSGSAVLNTSEHLRGFIRTLWWGVGSLTLSKPLLSKDPTLLRVCSRWSRLRRRRKKKRTSLPSTPKCSRLQEVTPAVVAAVTIRAWPGKQWQQGMAERVPVEIAGESAWGIGWRVGLRRARSGFLPSSPRCESAANGQLPSTSACLV